MPPQLLVVEDDADSREMLALLLQSYGFAVEVAARNKVARAQLAARAFDLVLADFMVDSHDPAVSWQHLDALVAAARPAPIGVMTSWPIQHDKAAAHGVAFVLPKPCTMDQLLENVSGLLALPPVDAVSEVTVRAYFAHLQAGDVEGVLGCCTEDVVYSLPSTGELVVGREAFRACTEQMLAQFENVRFSVEELRPLPRGLIAHYLGSWADGSKQAPGSVVFCLDGGLISEIGIRVDASTLS